MLVTAAAEVQQILAHVEQESVQVAEVEKVVKVDEEAAQVRRTTLSHCVYSPSAISTI